MKSLLRLWEGGGICVKLDYLLLSFNNVSWDVLVLQLGIYLVMSKTVFDLLLFQKAFMESSALFLHGGYCH